VIGIARFLAEMAPPQQAPIQAVMYNGGARADEIN